MAIGFLYFGVSCSEPYIDRFTQFFAQRVARNITIIPPEDKLRGTAVDKVKDWWTNLTGGGSTTS